MKRRPRDPSKKAISHNKALSTSVGEIGIVLSGGGARAAYQVGALKALIPYFKRSDHPIKVIVGSSIGAINGLILGACLKDGIEESVEALEMMWRKRNFRNTFSGSPSMAFLRAIKIAVLQYLSPGPNPTSDAVFDPTPLMQEIDAVILDKGGLHPDDRSPELESVAVMTTIEGQERKPLLFLSSHKDMEEEILRGASFEVFRVESMTARHGFASAALPSILPPVEIELEEGAVRLVDGGISQNVPVDPAARLGAQRVVIIDISGRNWWLERYDEALDTRPSWEVPAGFDTFCLRPPDTFVVRNLQPFGPLLKDAVSTSTRKFITAVGPIWPIFSLLKNKLGEEVAYETMSYVALDPDYLHGLIERGYNETTRMLRNKVEPDFHKNTSYKEAVEAAEVA